MKRNIRNIYIDGVEKSGKTSVIRELRIFLKEQHKDLHEINGTDLPILIKQQILLKDNEKSFILKENGLLSVYYNEFKKFNGIEHIEEEYHALIHMERVINHNYGAVHYFLIPEKVSAISERFDGGIPSYLPRVVDFYKNINLYQIAQGLDIRLIFFDDLDRIYDIRDKILKSLEDNFNLSS